MSEHHLRVKSLPRQPSKLFKGACLQVIRNFTWQHVLNRRHRRCRYRESPMEKVIFVSLYLRYHSLDGIRRK